MSSEYEIAAHLLSIFGANVVARKDPMTYGFYASAIGYDPAEYGIAVGKAMHALGALCILKMLPVAPLHWIRRADKGYRAIFESDSRERKEIVETGDIETMYVVTREYHYSKEEFDDLEKSLRKSLALNGPTRWSSHDLWHKTFDHRPPGSSQTFYQRAMAHYRDLYDRMKVEKL